MGTSPLTVFLFIQFLTVFSFVPTSFALDIEIGIGIGIGGSPSPTTPSEPSPPSPQPSPPSPQPSPPCPQPSPPSPQPSPPSPQPSPPCPQPSPPSPQPCDFASMFLYRSYFVIQAFKNTITCDPQGITKTWCGYDICSKTQYLGFYCATPPPFTNYTPAVAAVDFNGYALTAPTTEGFIDKLTELAIFHANSNNFSGNVPDLTSNNFFFELDLSNNKLSGLFPIKTIAEKNLTFLDIRFNKYTGCIPDGVFQLPMVEVIFLNNNNFSGTLPSNLGFSPVLYLSLANNLFTGPIPSSIGHAYKLLEVLFLNNQLSGCLPPEIGNLKKLLVFDAGFNMLTGTIPKSFGCLKSIQELNLAHNLLYGEVPESVCHLAYSGQLNNLTLSYNYFTWVGPTCWSLIKKGVLNIRKNCIPGVPDQRSAEECWWFAKQHKAYCPVSTYQPCWIPWGPGKKGINSISGSADEKAPIMDGGRDRDRKSGYTTYKALEGNPVP